MEPPLLPPGLVPAFALAFLSPRRTRRPPWRRQTLAFRAGLRYRGPWDDGSPPPDDAPLVPPLPYDDGSPLTDRERAAWGAFAVMLAFTLLAFVTVVLFTHSPMNAN